LTIDRMVWTPGSPQLCLPRCPHQRAALSASSNLCHCHFRGCWHKNSRGRATPESTPVCREQGSHRFAMPVTVEPEEQQRLCGRIQVPSPRVTHQSMESHPLSVNICRTGRWKSNSLISQLYFLGHGDLGPVHLCGGLLPHVLSNPTQMQQGGASAAFQSRHARPGDLPRK